MSTNHVTEESFLKDVAGHELQVIRDDGVNRHIRLKKPGTYCMHFDLITWPGALCYTGDMGTFVFSRLPDMFQFFRTDREHLREGATLGVNMSYWHEKLQAVDRSGGSEEFNAEKFKQVVSDARLYWIRHGGLDKGQRRELWEAVKDEVLDRAEDGGHAALSAAYDFSHYVGNRITGKNFQMDLYDYTFTQYTHGFEWCCYAIAWGIAAYDKAKAQVEVAA